MERKKVLSMAMIVLLTLLLMQGKVFAHLMLVEKVEEGVLLVRYDDGTISARSTVTLYDEEGNIVSEGSVDNQGLYHYDSQKPVYRAVADDGLGHRAHWVKGETKTWLEIPRWMRALLGVAVLLFIASFAYYRSNKKDT